MTIDTLIFNDSIWTIHNQAIETGGEADIVFLFGYRKALETSEPYDDIRRRYPNAHIVGCSTSGNILDDTVVNADMTATAVAFENGAVKVATNYLDGVEDQVAFARDLIESLPQQGLKHVFVLSDGLNINGSSLARGINEAYEGTIPATGGLAGDGDAFEQTWVIADAAARQNYVTAVGFYGEHLQISSGCFAGWDEFGILRRITRSEANIVYEIDGTPALELYKKYLGDFANDLPGSALRFPLSIRRREEDTPVIRSVLGINEKEKALIFAGDVPQGWLARLMKTNIDGLIDGAEIAARRIEQTNDKRALGLVVSCVGRRIVLDQLTDEELETISDTVGKSVQLTGFYSYGELAPFSDTLHSCHLHNQTLTLTIIYENEAT